jgi:hypothetical protein
MPPGGLQQWTPGAFFSATSTHSRAKQDNKNAAPIIMLATTTLAFAFLL